MIGADMEKKKSRAIEAVRKSNKMQKIKVTFDPSPRNEDVVEMLSPNIESTEGYESMTFQNIDSTEGPDLDRVVVQSLCKEIPTTSERDKRVQAMLMDITYDIRDRSASLDVTSPLREKSSIFRQFWQKK